MNILVYCTNTESMQRVEAVSQLLIQLPVTLQAVANRYKNDLSTYNYISGRLLVKQGLSTFGLDPDLEKIRFEQNGKPTIAGMYFNISHSAHRVICAFSQEGRLGVDIEKIKSIDFEDFTTMFSQEEWLTIQKAENPLRSFYWFWTRKESIIKAVGLNLSYLHQIELDVTSDHIDINGKKWFLRNIDIAPGYIASLCSEKEIDQLEMTEIDFLKNLS